MRALYRRTGREANNNQPKGLSAWSRIKDTLAAARKSKTTSEKPPENITQAQLEEAIRLHLTPLYAATQKLEDMVLELRQQLRVLQTQQLPEQQLKSAAAPFLQLPPQPVQVTPTPEQQPPSAQPDDAKLTNRKRRKRRRKGNRNENKEKIHANSVEKPQVSEPHGPKGAGHETNKGRDPSRKYNTPSYHRNIQIPQLQINVNITTAEPTKITQKPNVRAEKFRKRPYKQRPPRVCYRDQQPGIWVKKNLEIPTSHESPYHVAEATGTRKKDYKHFTVTQNQLRSAGLNKARQEAIAY